MYFHVDVVLTSKDLASNPVKNAWTPKFLEGPPIHEWAQLKQNGSDISPLLFYKLPHINWNLTHAFILGIGTMDK